MQTNVGKGHMEKRILSLIMLSANNLKNCFGVFTQMGLAEVPDVVDRESHQYQTLKTSE